MWGDLKFVENVAIRVLTIGLDNTLYISQIGIFIILISLIKN